MLLRPLSYRSLLVRRCSSRLRRITKQEVLKHNSPASAWIIIDGRVYDVTEFLTEHPGGGDKLMENHGDDRQKAFDEQEHSDDAKEIRDEYLIGELVDEQG